MVVTGVESVKMSMPNKSRLRKPCGHDDCTCEGDCKCTLTQAIQEFSQLFSQLSTQASGQEKNACHTQASKAPAVKTDDSKCNCSCTEHKTHIEDIFNSFHERRWDSSRLLDYFRNEQLFMVRFVHLVHSGNCTMNECCDTRKAVEFESVEFESAKFKDKVIVSELLHAVIQWAKEQHPEFFSEDMDEMANPCTPNVQEIEFKVLSATIVWKDLGRGQDLIKLCDRDKEEAHRQLEMIRRRGYVDWIEIAWETPRDASADVQTHEDENSE